MNAANPVQGQALLEQIVGAFNAGVRARNFSAFLDLFTEDAVVEYEGVPDGPLAGRAAIAERYSNDPPDDEICVRRWKMQGERIIAEFVWCDIPEARGGDIVVTPRSGRVAHLCVAFGGPSTRWN